MDDVKTGKAGRLLWGAAGVLLLLVWLVSMPLSDSRLCSAVLPCFGYAAVSLLAVAAMVVGVRLPRPTLTCLFGLAAGLYFFCRCVSGDMLSEICAELPLLFAAFLFYGAGFAVAGRRGGAVLTTALVVGVLLNVLYFFLMSSPDVPIEVSGRPAMSLAGPNFKGEGRTLFTYCNFSTLFLAVAGGLLICRFIWSGRVDWQGILTALVGMAGVVFSCLCSGNSVLVLLPLMLVFFWVFWVIIRLCSGQKLGYGVVLTGIALLVGVLVVFGELLLGNSLVQTIASMDPHGRTMHWRPMFGLLPQLPWYGYGSGASTWYVVPIVEGLASIPNYAHNEYLQAWVDYGLAGIALLVAVLLSPLTSGYWTLASEDVDLERRTLVAACMLLLLGVAACAVFEFVWHNMALVGLTAFACGVLAAPVPTRREPLFRRRRWAAGYRPALRPVRLMGRSLTALCCMGGLALAAVAGCFGWRLLPAWKAQWEYNALCQAGATEAERVVFLERVMEFYPDPALADHYASLRPPAVRRDNPARLEKVLRLALVSNPRQIFTLTMLADLLSNEGRCEEAECLLRDHYLPGGMPPTEMNNWPGPYGRNLLKWGHQRLQAGDHGAALSMMEYALNIWGHLGSFHHYRDGRERSLATEAYIAARRVDVDMLRAIGVQKDDSWMHPLRPGGAGSLYAEWGNEPTARTYSNPYSRHSPLKTPKK